MTSYTNHMVTLGFGGGGGGEKTNGMWFLQLEHFKIFNRYFLNVWYVQGTLLGSGTQHKTSETNPYLHGAYLPG